MIQADRAGAAKAATAPSAWNVWATVGDMAYYQRQSG
jgi:hypothetical protein